MTASVHHKATSKSFIIAATALLFSFSTATCLAAEASPANCSIAQYDLLSTYHEFSNTPNDNQLKRNLVASNKALSECMSTMSATLTPDITNELNAAQKGMQTELSYNINSLEKTGATPGQPVANMVNFALETTKLLGSQIDGKNKTVGALRKQAVLMAYIKSRYLERIYSIGSDMFRETSAELSIEELVLDFSKKLDILRKDKTMIADAELYKKLNAAHVRFNFLQKSIMNYNKTAVPFVVGHHSAFIIKTLLDISNELEQKSAKAA